MMSDSGSASELMYLTTKARPKINSLNSFAHFANCTSDLSAGTCRRLPMMGDPLGPGGSGYFDFEPWGYNLAARNITTTAPKMANPKLPFRLSRASGNKFMISVAIIYFPSCPSILCRSSATVPWSYIHIAKTVCIRSLRCRCMAVK